MQLFLVLSGLFAAVAAQTVCVAPSSDNEKISKSNIKSTANVVLSGDSGENFSKPFSELTAEDMEKMMKNGYCETKRNKREAGDKTVDRATQKNLPPPKAATTKAAAKTTKAAAKTTKAAAKTTKAAAQTTKGAAKTTRATAKTTKASNFQQNNQKTTKASAKTTRGAAQTTRATAKTTRVSAQTTRGAGAQTTRGSGAQTTRGSGAQTTRGSGAQTTKATAKTTRAAGQAAKGKISISKASDGLDFKGKAYLPPSK